MKMFTKVSLRVEWKLTLGVVKLGRYVYWV